MEVVGLQEDISKPRRDSAAKYGPVGTMPNGLRTKEEATRTEINWDALTLDCFELLDSQESLGKGSFGVVQKVRRKGTNEVYALKSMRKHEVIDGNLIEQVEMEIQVQKELKHPNVLRLYRHFEDSDTVYLLLELCGKGELYQILRTQKYRRFSEEVACKYFVQVAEGLDYLHREKTIHRDIKPENLLVNDDDVLKIADFGWCAVSSEIRLTFCGTLDYLAPEMILAKGHDHTLDVWSAGVLLYEMVVGRPPFQSTNHGQLISKILKLELNFPEANPASQLLQDLVRRLLKHEPADRLSLQDAIRHPWVMQFQADKKGIVTPFVTSLDARTNSRHRESSQHYRNDDENTSRALGRESTTEEVESEPEPRTKGSTELRSPALDEASHVVTVSTPSVISRGLQSPRVPGGPQYPYATPAQAGITRAGVVAPTTMVVSPSPHSTPVVVPRQTKEQPIHIMTGTSTSTPMVVESGKDELSRTYGTRKLPTSKTFPPMTPSSATPKPESFVYVPSNRPLNPMHSPITACRKLDTSSEAPGTPVQRQPFRAEMRSRTLSPQGETRAMISEGTTGKMTTVEAVHRGMAGRAVAAGSSASAPQKRDLQRPREPSLHHASSQHALQRGGAVPSTGSGGDASGSRAGPTAPSSPQIQTRRLSHAQPANIGETVGRSPVTMTGLTTAPSRVTDEDKHSARRNEDMGSFISRRSDKTSEPRSGTTTASRDQPVRSMPPGRPQAITSPQLESRAAPSVLPQFGHSCPSRMMVPQFGHMHSTAPAAPIRYQARPYL